MGIGRRDFLMLFGAMLARTSSQNGGAVVLDDWYVNHHLGIAFSKPSDWTFHSMKQVAEVVSRQLLDLGNPDILRKWASNPHLPVLALSGETSDDGDPGIPGVTVHMRCFPGSVDVDVLKTAVIDTDYVREWLGAVDLDTPPVVTVVSKCKASTYSGSFQRDGVRLRMHYYAVWQPPKAYAFRIFEYADTVPRRNIDVQRFVASIQLA